MNTGIGGLIAHPARRLTEMETAHKDAWKTQPMPRETAVLGYSGQFSSEEFEKISLGLIPKEMEDKWFIYLDGTTLHLHRSWTGICIFEVEFEEIAGKHIVRRALVNRNQTQYRGTDYAYDSALLHFLISNLLLGKQVKFPIPSALPKGVPTAIFQHHISGTAYPEKPVNSNLASGPARRKPWWKF